MRALIEVHGHGKEGASFGYSGVRGLNASAAAVTAPGGAPVIARTRLHADSAYYGRPTVRAAVNGGAQVSITGPPAGPDQASLFAVWRFHSFFTTFPEDQMDTVTADKTHRGHANAAWLILAVIAFNARLGRGHHRQRSTH